VSRKGVIEELESVPLKKFGGCSGRRPAGWIARGAASCMSALGEYFARMAELEAASVTAFEVLRAELEHHGAPQALIDAARAAARDEVRHAQSMAALASALGASTHPLRVAPQPLRTLEQIALDNAVEGCVRETFGAAIGCYQAQTAADRRIAALMREIAADETRHAALAFELDAWLAPQLPAATRERVQSARNDAIAALASELSELSEPDHALRHLAGLPDANRAASLHAVLQRDLWGTC
jgi:rubrerythrin